MTEINYLTQTPSELRRAARAELRRQCHRLILDLHTDHEMAEILKLSLPRLRRLKAETMARDVPNQYFKNLDDWKAEKLLDLEASRQYCIKKLKESSEPTIRTRKLKKTKTAKQKDASGNESYVTVDDGTEETTEFIANKENPLWMGKLIDVEKEICKLRGLYPKETGPAPTTQVLVIVAEERVQTPINMIDSPQAPPPLPISAMLPPSFVFDDEPPPDEEPSTTPPPLPNLPI